MAEFKNNQYSRRKFNSQMLSGVITLGHSPSLLAQNTSIIKDIRIWVDKDRANPTSDLKNILSELSLEKSNLGIEYEAYGLTGRNAISLNNSLEKFAILHDKSELVSCLRVIKSSAEIVYVKKAAALADKAMEAAWKYAHAMENEAKILSGITNVRKAAKQIQTLGTESVIITGISTSK